MLKKEKIIKILKILSKKIPKDIRWMVIAGTNLVLRNIKEETKDIDIVTTKDGLSVFKEKLKEFIVEKNRSNKSQNYIAEDFNIEGIDVEVMYDFIVTSYTNSLVNGFTDDYALANKTIKLLQLEKEEEGYRITSRKEKADLIKNFLEKQNN